MDWTDAGTWGGLATLLEEPEAMEALGSEPPIEEVAAAQQEIVDFVAAVEAELGAAMAADCSVRRLYPRTSTHTTTPPTSPTSLSVSYTHLTLPTILLV